MKVTIEETLASSAVDTALTNAPYLIYSEVIEGARRNLAFLQVVQEDFSLIGSTGHQLQYLEASQLGATESTEAQALAGMSASDKTLSATILSVSKVIWSAVQLSDWLREEYPKINWIRIHLRNMGSAVMEYLDGLVYTALAACTTVTHTVTTLDYSGVTDALAKMANNNWVEDDMNPPFLIIAPEAKAGMLQDTLFEDARRYTVNKLSKIVQGEIGMYGGCRVLTSPYLDGKAYAFIVFPPNTAYGPVVVVAWKRRLRVVNEYEATKSYTYFNTSIRANVAVVQAKGVCRITQSTTP